MASTTRIPRARLTGIYGALVTRMARKMLGGVPESIEVAWHHPQVRNFTLGLGRKVQKWHRCDESLKAYAHMAAASLVGCRFCLDLGYFQAKREGLDVAKVREVPRWRTSQIFSELERDVMAYAEAMTVTPPAVTDELSGRLLAALGPAALVELTTHVGLTNFVTRTNVAWGVGPQGLAAACGLAPLATPSGELRPTA
ncbi:MAG: carboxymuconolactone decarboxylase family protein [Acidimicrobiales bacterium]